MPEDQDIHANLDQPLTANEIEEAQAAGVELPELGGESDVESVEKKTVEESAESSPTESSIPEDKKAAGFDCSECDGEGLISNVIFPNGKICENCGGTGKNRELAGEYPEGTIQLRQDGQYRYSNGSWEKVS